MNINEIHHLADEEDELIEISNIINEKFSNLKNFKYADHYLTSEIQKKFGEVAGYKTPANEIIKNVCDLLNITEKELRS